MKKKHIYLIPGPTKVPAKISRAYQRDFYTANLEKDFETIYKETAKNLAKIMQTKNQVVMLSGEAMVGLWAGLKNTLKSGDRVLAIDNGIFGHGIGEMAKSIGANVLTLSFDYDKAPTDYNKIAAAIKKHKPKMITAVHCETPSGMLNPLLKIGTLKKQFKVPLFYVDAVASVGGAEVKVDDWNIDICLGGGQKALSTFPDLGFLSISKTAWEHIEKIAYVGYDALSPLQNPFQYPYFTYAQNWGGVAALNIASKMLLQEGLENVFLRHKKASQFCIQKIRTMGLEIYPADEKYSSPTVTAVKIPKNISWQKLNKSLLANGLSVGGSFGPLAGKIFRIGHMGSQTNLMLLKQGFGIFEKVLVER